MCRSATPLVSRMLNSTSLLREAVDFLGTSLEFVQGRGSGWGWDMRGEAIAARQFLRDTDNPVIFDVGANYGEWSTEMSRVLGSRPHRLFLFEPQRVCQEELARAADANRVLISAGLGAEPGLATMYAERPGCGRASLYVQRAQDGSSLTLETDTVPVRTVDQEMERLDLKRIDLMKVDVEGAEMEVLRGAATALATGRIETLTFEFGSPNIESRVFFRDFWNLLTPAGYRLWRICPGGVLFPVARYDEKLENFRRVSNYIASRRLPVRAR